MSIMRQENKRKTLVFAAALLPLLFFCAQAFSQSSSISGTVVDASKAVLPGATITATNVATSVKSTTTTNNAGVYNFPALPPGSYKLTAEMPGFQTQTMTDVALGTSPARLNFELSVQGVATRIEVSTSAQDMLLESGSSTGTVLESRTVTELPLINNDLMDLVNVMGGVVRPEDTVFGNSNQSFAGVPGSQVNVARDGVSVSEVRYVSGISAASRLNPEMIGEFKLVLSSVDAELGRGGGQVQVVTKSGANAFHGSGVWDVQNTALDANEWSANRNGVRPDWRNLNEYTITANGPIKKNKTFFFAMFNHAIPRARTNVTANVLTNCARKGIYRYFDGWINGTGYNAATTRASATGATRAVVDRAGNPLTPTETWDNKPYTGKLEYFSVLGQLTSASKALLDADPINCSQYLPNGLDIASDNGLVANTPWDTSNGGAAFRAKFDQSGFMQRFMKLMPTANDFSAGDGLNNANIRWLRTTAGSDNLFGMGEDNARKQFTVKIDHNLNVNHRLSGSVMYERNISGDGYEVWPNGFRGAQERYPLQIASTLTSTLRPTLLNEFRFGFGRTLSHTLDAMHSSATGAAALKLLDTLMPTEGFPNYNGFPLIVNPSGFAAGSSHPIGGRGYIVGVMGGTDVRSTFADTLTWTRGRHSIKGGFEIRMSHSDQDSNGNGMGSLTLPQVAGGQTSYAQATGLTAAMANGFWTGLTGQDQGTTGATGTYSGAYNLMNLMAGSVASIGQYYYVNSPTQTNWNDPTKGELFRVVTMQQREFSVFFKDDWKLNSSLTLNLGIRYDYYGIPWLNSGMTLGVKDGFMKVFGQSVRGFNDWMPTNPVYDATVPLTALEFVGPNSPNPGRTYLNKDLNNIGPAVGFAWQLPWFGRGKTTLRGGYQLSYLTLTTLDPNSGVGPAIANAPGTTYAHSYGGDSTNKYMDLANISKFVPTSMFLPSTIQPLVPRPISDRSAYLTVYNPDTRQPYVQSLNMSLTRNIGSSLTVDVRYIGTLSRKQISGVNLNAPNFINNGLIALLDDARAGRANATLDAMFKPFTLWYASGGADQLRTHWATATALATGNYASVANALTGGAYTASNGTFTAPAGVYGELFRRNGIAENYIWANPAFAGATLNGNYNNANYHSMQAQVTMRPKRGLNFQTTYTWSRSLGLNSAADVRNRDLDYGLSGMNRSHAITTQGTYILPFGANGYLFRDASKFMKRVIEGWQLSWVGTYSSGVPASISQTTSMWGGSGVDLVRADLWDNKAGHATWDPGARNGWYFGPNTYMQVNDPQCDNVTTLNGLQTTCRNNLKALAIVDHIDANGNKVAGPIVFQHAKPGTRGNFNANQLTSLGRWNLDTAMGKSFEFMEGKTITLRVDAQNIFNHPTPSGSAASSYNGRTYAANAPSFNLNSTSTPFGYIGSKAGHRVFSAKIRVNF